MTVLLGLDGETTLNPTVLLLKLLRYELPLVRTGLLLLAWTICVEEKHEIDTKDSNTGNLKIRLLIHLGNAAVVLLGNPGCATINQRYYGTRKIIEGITEHFDFLFVAAR